MMPVLHGHVCAAYSTELETMLDRKLTYSDDLEDICYTKVGSRSCILSEPRRF